MAQTAVEMLAECLRLIHKEAYNDLYEDIETYYKKIEKEQMFGFTNHHHVIGEGTEKFFKEEFELWYKETFNK